MAVCRRSVHLGTGRSARQEKGLVSAMRLLAGLPCQTTRSSPAGKHTSLYFRLVGPFFLPHLRNGQRASKSISCDLFVAEQVHSLPMLYLLVSPRDETVVNR